MRSRQNKRRGTDSAEPSPSSFSNSSKLQTQKLIKPANYKQKQYIDSIRHNVISLVTGPAGTGKSILALHTAICLLNSQDSPIEKIFYLRPNVGLQEEREIGHLPGSMLEKIMPLAYPVLDNLIAFMQEGHAKYYLEKGRIEVLPIAMVRGRSFANSVVIADEIQSLSPHGVKTILTRVGENSKLILMGDSTQKDSKVSIQDGLSDAVRRLKGLPNVGVIEFTSNEIIRHPIIQHILERYN